VDGEAAGRRNQCTLCNTHWSKCKSLCFMSYLRRRGSSRFADIRLFVVPRTSLNSRRYVFRTYQGSLILLKIVTMNSKLAKICNVDTQQSLQKCSWDTQCGPLTTYVLFRINMAENWNCSQRSVKVLHTEIYEHPPSGS
jgi:hypothetical protein